MGQKQSAELSGIQQIERKRGKGISGKRLRIRWKKAPNGQAFAPSSPTLNTEKKNTSASTPKVSNFSAIRTEEFASPSELTIGTQPETPDLLIDGLAPPSTGTPSKALLGVPYSGSGQQITSPPRSMPDITETVTGDKPVHHDAPGTPTRPFPKHQIFVVEEMESTNSLSPRSRLRHLRGLPSNDEESPRDEIPTTPESGSPTDSAWTLPPTVLRVTPTIPQERSLPMVEETKEEAKPDNQMKALSPQRKWTHFFRSPTLFGSAKKTQSVENKDSEDSSSSLNKFALRPNPKEAKRSRRRRKKSTSPPTSPNSIVHHPIPVPDVVPSRTVPPPVPSGTTTSDFSFDKTGSVDRQTLSEFSKLKIQVQVANRNAMAKKRAARKEDKNEDIRGYHGLWQEFENIERTIESTSPRKNGRSSNKLSRSRRKKKRNFNLQNATTWFVNFEAFETGKTREEEAFEALLESVCGVPTTIIDEKKSKYRELVKPVEEDRRPQITGYFKASPPPTTPRGISLSYVAQTSPHQSTYRDSQGDIVNYAMLGSSLLSEFASAHNDEESCTKPSSESPVDKHDALDKKMSDSPNGKQLSPHTPLPGVAGVDKAKAEKSGAIHELRDYGTPRSLLSNRSFDTDSEFHTPRATDETGGNDESDVISELRDYGTPRRILSTNSSSDKENDYHVPIRRPQRPSPVGAELSITSSFSTDSNDGDSWLRSHSNSLSLEDGTDSTTADVLEQQREDSSSSSALKARLPLAPRCLTTQDFVLRNAESCLKQVSATRESLRKLRVEVSSKESLIVDEHENTSPIVNVANMSQGVVTTGDNSEGHGPVEKNPLNKSKPGIDASGDAALALLHSVTSSHAAVTDVGHNTEDEITPQGADKAAGDEHEHNLLDSMANDLSEREPASPYKSENSPINEAERDTADSEVQKSPTGAFVPITEPVEKSVSENAVDELEGSLDKSLKGSASRENDLCCQSMAHSVRDWNDVLVSNTGASLVNEQTSKNYADTSSENCDVFTNQEISSMDAAPVSSALAESQVERISSLEPQDPEESCEAEDQNDDPSVSSAIFNQSPVALERSHTELTDKLLEELAAGMAEC